MDYYIRKSNNIEADFKRGWSSWNFGNEGIEGDKNEIIDLLEDAVHSEAMISVSGFDVWPESVQVALYRIIVSTSNSSDIILSELRKNYWVAIDTECGGVAATKIDVKTLEEAITIFDEKGEDLIDFGDQTGFDPNCSKVIKSIDDVHLIVEE